MATKRPKPSLLCVEYMNHRGDWLSEKDWFHDHTLAKSIIRFTLGTSHTIRQARLTDTTTGLVEYF